MDKSASAPNIILIMTDQMRGDCLGVAGHPDVKTPFLDTLAVQGSYFPNAYSACPSCIPARAALMTGMSQERNGRVGYEDGVLWDYPRMLPALLAQAGYQTHCAGKLHVDPPRLGCGFHSVDLHDGALSYYRRPDTPYCEHQFVTDDYLHFLREHLGPDADITDTGLECNSWLARPWPYEERLHPTNWAVTRSIDFLRRRDRTRPFFLMTSFVRPHPPFDAPACYFEPYRRAALRVPAAGAWRDQERLERTGRIFDSLSGTLDPELQRQAMAGYYACISHVDHQIGRLMQALMADGSYEDSLILFTSDHGEQLFDHATFRKAYPYQGSVRVPLLIRPGENLPGARGQVRPELAELRDILPTVLDCAGVPIPPDVDGVSLMPAVRGEHMEGRPHLHGEHSFGELSSQFIVTRRDKYIWFSQTGREQYFDLLDDPREERDRIGDPACAQRVEALRKTLIACLTGREEGYTDGERLTVGCPPLNLLGRKP